jgi:hypothetical protein
MGITTQQIFASQTILQVVSQMNLAGTTLQRLFGWGFGGKNIARQSGRSFSYDIFDNTRSVATARVPGQTTGRQPPRKVGVVQGTFPRAAEAITLLDEDLLNRRFIADSASEIGVNGEAFLTRQEAYLAQRFANLIEFQTAAMLRGSYCFADDGDDLRHSFNTGPVTVNFRIPAGNKDKLDMLGDGDIITGDWSAAETDIPLQLQQINAAMLQLTGMGLSHVVVTGVGWQHLVNNQRIQAMGGSTNVVFDSLKRTKTGEFEAVLRALPWITFHIVDYGLDVWDGTAEVFTKLIEDDHAAFFPGPSPRWAQYVEGSEIVTEGPGGVKAERFGFYPYAYPKHDPSGWELCAVMNGIPALYTPSAVAYGRIVG